MLLEELRDAAHLEILRQVYEGSFPEEERRLWTDVLNPADPAGPHLSGIFREGTDRPLGLVTIWHFDGFDYMEHFAVDSTLRSGGVGTAVLTALTGSSDRPLVIEVEPPQTSPEAVRRIGFYTRNGFETVTTDYIQPPYRPGLPPVPLHIMSTRPDALPDTDTVIKTLHRRVYKAQ